MARRSIAERLAQLDARKKTLQARLGKQDRASDTRRKVLLGALVLQRLATPDDMEFSERLRDWLRRELPGFLTRDADKLLLADLVAPKPAQENKAADELAKEKATMATPPASPARTSHLDDQIVLEAGILETPARRVAQDSRAAGPGEIDAVVNVAVNP